MKKKQNITTFELLLNKEYGKRGTIRRESYEREYESFKLGVMLQELRKEMGWDEQIASDAAAGKLDHLANQALKDFRSGKFMEL